MAKSSGIPLSQCPTCLSRTDPDLYVHVPGTFRYRGEEYQCDCDTQMELRLHYLIAGIGDQYQRLDWADFRGTPAAKEAVDLFLDRWDSFRLNGMGLEFSSPNLGVGKTFAATHVGKELIKRGVQVRFVPFLSAVRILLEDREMEEQLRSIQVLILDEVVPAMSEAQGALFAMKFEELIRHRTNFNLVNIITTNLTPQQLHDAYPRTYSLMEAKQLRIEMGGEDARQSYIEMENIELVANGEVRPIT